MRGKLTILQQLFLTRLEFHPYIVNNLIRENGAQKDFEKGCAEGAVCGHLFHNIS